MSLSDGGQKSTDLVQQSQGPYVLLELFNNVPLVGEGSTADQVHISCVEYWQGNLYVGTSEGHLIHFVPLPEAEDQKDASPTWIQGSRRHLAANAGAAGRDDSAVRQILILPATSHAFVLCQGVVTFYTLPELSPTFTSVNLTDCSWIGGVDQSEDTLEAQAQRSTIIVICQGGKLRIVRVSDKIKRIRNIDYGGCLEIVRRGDIACVADSHEYSLLDIVEQQRVPLFPVSTKPSEDIDRANPHQRSNDPPTSMDDSHDGKETEVVVAPTITSEDLATTNEPSQSSDSSSSVLDRSQTSSDSTLPPRNSSLVLSELAAHSHPSSEAPLGPALAESKKLDHDKNTIASRDGSPQTRQLRPVIVSPSSNEFLLVTGTSPLEPGIGMFVNTDGELTPRGTIEFSSYPVSVCVDGAGKDTTTGGQMNSPSSAGSILAVVFKSAGRDRHRAIQIRCWDTDSTESSDVDHWLRLDRVAEPPSAPLDSDCLIRAGCRNLINDVDCALSSITDLLSPVPLTFTNDRIATEPPPAGSLSRARARVNLESQLYARLSTFKTGMVAWADDCIWAIIKNPLAVQMEKRLMESVKFSQAHLIVDRHQVETILGSMQDLEPSSELEFYSFNYIRQKCAIVLFLDLLYSASRDYIVYERDRSLTADALMRADIDPRILVLLIPELKLEVVQGSEGIWVQRGLKTLLDRALSLHSGSVSLFALGESGHQIIQIVKSYLLLWRKKKGLESVADKEYMFPSVDAALLRLLLILDADSPPGPARKGSVRSELNALIDGGVDCFERAVLMLEEFRRLYVLSWLYETHKMPRQVLSTWRRIIEGAEDVGGEFGDAGETKLRKYLGRIEDRDLVTEYGSWLARRNPSLGVRVFADASSRVTFAPEDAVEILKREAPGAVKIFLEHLVFDNNLATYATDLINYYLDSVLAELSATGDARDALLSSYTEYRAMKVPKPTYSQFAGSMSIDADWWRNRLRLVQLLGGSHGAASQYDVPGMLERIAPYHRELVPETIVLAGKQGQHGEAIRLLVRALGDFDTAVTYCLRGGSSTYSPVTGALPKEAVPSREEQESLFACLLDEFLALEEADDRVTQTSQLLERFAGWFDPTEVLLKLPAEWPVGTLAPFFEACLRALVVERRDTAMTRALLSCNNLDANHALVEKLASIGPRVVSAPLAA